MRKQIIGTVIFLTISGIIITIPHTAYAETNQNPIDSIIQTLAKKLGIGQDKIQTAFDTIRNERRAQMENQFKNRLDQAVKNGEITNVQKKLIIAKHEELQKLRDLERQNRLNKRSELESWAKQNNIDPQYVFGFGKMMGSAHDWRGKGIGKAWSN